MRLFALIFFILLNLPLASISQKQNNQWRFGRAGGINFNVNPPTFVAGSSIQASEGSASVADRNTGSLLFYTDGVTVWNAQDQIMPNGNGLLGGNTILLSSTTAAVIIPKPASNVEYYVVTIDEQASSNGVRYSLVDMRLDNGLGDIVPGQKNIPIFSTGSEKLEVVPTADGAGYWLLTHDNPGNSFFAFKITSSGIQTNPVVSTVGGVQGNGSGHMKVNRQFTKLAMGNFFDRTIELFDFNQTTGVVSNPIIWNTSVSQPNIYGIEFSPNGKKIYVSNLELIIQYDITQNNAADILNSRYAIVGSVFFQPASLQLGPDQKIYVNAGSIDVISCPDLDRDACGFQRNAIANQSGGGGYGLPKWVFYPNDIPDTVSRRILFRDSCFQNSTQFSLNDTIGVLNVSWLFGDPNSGSANTATGLSATHAFSQPGLFSIRAVLTTRCGFDTVFLNGINILNCNIPCTGVIRYSSDTCVQNQVSFRIESDQTPLRVEWNFGDTASGTNNTAVGLMSMHQFSAPGKYLIRAIVNFPCGQDTLYKFIHILDCAPPTSDCKLYIPNAFSPNGDGLNDRFTALSACTPEIYQASIYNQWGNLIFRSSDRANAWDGTYRGARCAPGVYVYLIQCKLPFQSTQQLRGTVVLLR
jgi:gliding motility-associated-like protein